MLTDSLVHACDVWAAWIVAVTWQLAVLAVVAWGVERVLRLRQPGARYALWWFVLVAPLVLGPVRIGLAESERVFRVPPAAVQRVARVSVPVALPAARGGGFMVARAPRAASGVSSSAPEAVSWWSRVRAIDALIALWAAGYVVLSARLVVGHVCARGLVRGGRPVEESAREVLSALCEQAGVREVELRTSARVGAPVLYGVRRPVILVPEGWLDGFDAAQLRALLAHEVAHVKRGDCMANVVQRLCEIPAFFHPGVWLASKRIALAREELADRWALAMGTDAGSYARSLAAVAERARVSVGAVSLGVAEGKSSLTKRVEAIMRGASLKRVSRPLVVALIGLALVSAVAFAAVQVCEEPSAVADGSTSDLGSLEGEMKDLALAVAMYVQGSKGVYPQTDDIREIRSILEPYMASEKVFLHDLRWVMPPGIGVSEIENAAATPVAVLTQAKYTVTAYVDGHVDSRDEDWEKNHQRPTEGVVDFVIVDGGGAPIVGAKVRPLEGAASPVFTADAKGECTGISVVGGSTCFLIESPDGKVRRIVEAYGGEGTHKQTVTLGPAERSNMVKLSGRIVNDRGRPVEGAELWLYGFGQIDIIFLSREIGRSGSGGRFDVEIPRVSSGQTGWGSGWIDHWGCWILAHKTGYGLGWTERVGADEVTDVEVRLTRPATLRGLVLGSGAGPLEGAPLGITQVRIPARGSDAGKALQIGFGFAKAPSYLATRTNGKGEFAFADLPKDAIVSLEVSTCGAGEENYVYTGKDVKDVNLADQRSPLVIELVPKSETYGSLEGTVLLPDGSPAKDLPVEASYLEKVPTGGMYHRGSGRTDVDGKYRITQLVRGTYSLIVFTQEWAGSQRDAVTVEAGEEVHAPTLTVQKTARVKGRVLDSDTGEPVSAAGVSASSQQHGIGWGQPAARLGMAATGPDGTFEVICPPGDVEVRANGRGYAPPRVIERVRAKDRPRLRVSLDRGKRSETRVTLGSGEVSKDLTLYLQGKTLASVSGRVIVPGDIPLREAFVDASFDRSQVEQERGVWMGGSGLVDADGSFSLQGLLAGVPYTIDVLAREPGLAGSASVTLATGETRNMVIHMYPLVPVRGRVLMPDGRPAAGADVFESGVGIPPGKTDEKGVFEAKLGIVGRSFAASAFFTIPPDANPGQPVERFRGISGVFEVTQDTKSIDVGNIVLEPYDPRSSN